MKKTLVTLLMLLSLPFMAYAEDAKESNIIVEKVWTRPTMGIAKNGAIYMSVINNGKEPDTLLLAESDIADKVELHKTTQVNGVSSMVHVSKISIPAGQTVKFAPQGLHIMIMGVKHDLRQGDTFPLALTFEKAGKMQTTVHVTLDEHGKLK